MFKPHYGYCRFCEKYDQIIVVKSGHCQRCNHDQKIANKKASGKFKPTTTKYREPTGEKDVFLEVLDNLPDTETRCFVCGIRIAAVTHSNFAHVLPKGKYPNFRLYANNIKLLCHPLIGDAGCHYKWDFKPRSELMNDVKWDKMFALEEQLKLEYRHQ